jgi:hypothetical protein
VDGRALAVPAPGLLGNDTDVEGDAISAVPATVTTAGGGALSVAADGSVTYTPRPGFHGADAATYVVRDAHGAEATGTVTFQVQAGTALTATRAAHAGGQATVSGTLRAVGDGHPVAGAVIGFFLNDNRLFCVATTNAAGVATCTAPVPDMFFGLLGRYSALFGGDADYLAAASASTPFGTLTF